MEGWEEGEMAFVTQREGCQEKLKYMSSKEGNEEMVTQGEGK